MNRYRIWHWLRGHGWPKTVEFDPYALEQQAKEKGYPLNALHGIMPMIALTVVDRCPGCGGEWVFGVTTSLEEVYYPDGCGVYDLPDLRPRDGGL